jgi:hypothetical protein
MTLRRLWVLVHGLPARSHTARAIHGEAADWDVQAHLLRQIGNALIIGNGQRAGKRVRDGELIPAPKNEAVIAQIATTSIRRKRPPTRDPEVGGWRELDKLFNAD